MAAPLARSQSLLKNCNTPQAKSATKPKLDRFIPSRSGMDFDAAHYQLHKENECAAGPSSPSQGTYKQRLAESMLNDDQARILSFKHKAPAPPPGYQSNLAGLYSQNAARKPAAKPSRALPQQPERVLDAPDIRDDYYLNLVDWSSTNQVAIALGPSVFLWNAGTGSIAELAACREEDDHVTSVSWAADGKHIAVGTASATVQIWDAGRSKQIRSLRGHAARVGSLAWNNTTLSSGSRDASIINHDVRIRDHVQAVLQGHEQEVCGLRWSINGQQLASGGNDNLLHVWAAGAATGQAPSLRLTAHSAAVKALAWCPFQSNLLASGGGTADRCIRFWNSHTGALLNSIDTNSQVCALQWNPHEREILSSHGFSQNQLCLWKYPSMAKIAEFTGHTARVLHLARSPDGTTVCSAAADETLRFWNCFGDPTPAASAKVSSLTALSSVKIRYRCFSTPPPLVFLNTTNTWDIVIS